MKDTRDRAVCPCGYGHVYNGKIRAMLGRFFAAFFAFVLLPAAFCLILAAQAEAIGRFTHVEGRVDVLKEGKAPAVPAKVGDTVSVKDIIRTRSDSRAEIAFADGNIVRLAQRSRIDISEYVADEAVSRAVLNLPRGKVHATVDKKVVNRIVASPNANRFEIRTPVAVAGVRGTKFFVIHERGVTNVLVDEGTVEVYNLNFPDEKVIVTAGNSTTVTERKPPAPPRPATETEMRRHHRDTAPPAKEKAEKEAKAIEAAPADGKEQARSAEAAALEEAVIAATTTAPLIEPDAPVPPTLTDDVRPPFTETHPGAGGDKTTPVVTITAGQPAVTSSNVAYFEFSAPEEVTFLYRLDGGQWTPTTETLKLTDLEEGIRTIEIKATDAAGNISTISYTWTIDYTPPASLTLTGTPPAITQFNNADIGATADDTTAITYSYTLNGVSVDSGNLTGLPEGINTFTVTATDAAGNTSTTSYSWFIGTRQYVLTGGLTGDLAGEVQPASEGIRAISNQPVGAWLLDYKGSGTPPPQPLKLVAGGRGDDPNDPAPFDGYWLSKITATASDGNITGTSTLTYLSGTTLGTGTGIFSGLYDADTWQATDLGLGTYTETPLAFSAKVKGGFLLANSSTMDKDSSLEGLLGGTGSLWDGAPVPVIAMGEYKNPNAGQFPVALIEGTTIDGGVFKGLFGGLSSDEAFDGRFLGIYIDPDGKTGYLMSDVAGFSYPGISMWMADGTMNILPVSTTNLLPKFKSFSLEPTTLRGSTTGSFSVPGGGTISGPAPRISELQTINLDGTPWGIWMTGLWGGYSGTISNTWSARDKGELLTPEGALVAYYVMDITGNRWSDKRLSGTITGSWTDISKAPSTGIYVGETFGTFNPADKTWQAVSMGVRMDTGQFLRMAADTSPGGGQSKLQQLNIPAVEVGEVNLIGKNDNLDVQMHHVKFFAPSTGARPSIWATNKVSGNYTGQPIVNSSINLSSGAGGPKGLHATFTLRQWDTTTNRWLATVSGEGNIPGGGTNTQNLTFQGAAAGTIAPSSGTISGTAAGVAR